MAIIGRLACHICDFPGAHVKRNEAKHPYHHCPNCGVTTATKNGHQEKLLLAKMRPVDGYVPEPPGAAEPILVPGGAQAKATPAPAARTAELQSAAADPAAKPSKPATWLDAFLKS